MNKLTLCTLICLLFLSQLIEAQIDSLTLNQNSTTSESSSDSAVLGTLLSIKNDLDELKKRINTDTSISDKTGDIYFIAKTNLYENDSIIKTITIEEVEIYVEDGKIRSIRCTDSDVNIYYRSQMNIFLKGIESKFGFSGTIFKKYFNPKLYNINLNKTLYIKPYDFIRYQSVIGNYYIPEDAIIKLNKDKDRVAVTKEVDLNSHVEFKLYSDLLGLLEQEPNGLLQAELASRIRWNYMPNLIAIKYVRPNAIFKRYDSSISRYPLTFESGNTINEQTYLDIIQRSFLDLGLDVGLMEASSSNVKFDIHAGFNYAFTKVLFPEPDSTESNLTFSTIKFGATYKFLRYRNFGLILDFDFLMPNFAKTTEVRPVNEPNFLSFGAEIFYHPLKNRKNQVYVRFNLLSPVDNKSPLKNIPFLQIGYKSKLQFNNKKGS